MKKEFNYAFIASSKVIRHKLGNSAADVLATLAYKKRYWKAEKKLFKYKEDMGFYISISDLQEETCMKPHTIKKALARLKKENLIISKQRGLGKPNFYALEEEQIERYIESYKEEYDNWRLMIRSKNSSVSSVNSKTELKQLSRENSDNLQERTETTTTNNKITNNKKTDKITNHINVVSKKNDVMRHSDKLEELIDNARGVYSNEDRFEKIMALYDFLCKVLPSFKKFNISDQDFQLISDSICDSKMEKWTIASRILKNSIAIQEGRKKMRFGNLFVGLKEMNENCELRYS